jgi:hypothetical protein
VQPVFNDFRYEENGISVLLRYATTLVVADECCPCCRQGMLATKVLGMRVANACDVHDSELSGLLPEVAQVIDRAKHELRTKMESRQCLNQHGENGGGI